MVIVLTVNDKLFERKSGSAIENGGYYISILNTAEWLNGFIPANSCIGRSVLDLKSHPLKFKLLTSSMWKYIKTFIQFKSAKSE